MLEFKLTTVNYTCQMQFITLTVGGKCVYAFVIVLLLFAQP